MKDTNYLVYIHINRQNNKIYVGLTRQELSRRWQASAYKNCTHFERAIKKYGWDAFEHIVVADNLTANEASAMEIRLIHDFQTTNPQYGYNCDPGGIKRLYMSEATKEKLRRCNLGKKYSEVTKEKHRINAKNRVVHFNELARKNAKQARSVQISQYDDNKRLIRHWDSVTSAAVSLGISHQGISRCLQGKSHTCGGYYWSYLNGHIVEPIKTIRILQIEPSTGKVVDEYISFLDAEIKTGVSKSNIHAVCNGRRKTAGGFAWRKCELEGTTTNGKKEE